MHITQAAGDSPWSEILNPDGSVKWSALTDLGVTSDQASWMTITLPGGMVVHLDATYHRYKTASGNILVLPSPTTLFFMAMHPQESGLSGAQDMLGNGASILFALIGGSLTPAQLAQLAAKGYTNKAIAVQLDISDRTVQGHLAHIFDKLQADSRTEAVMRAVSLGWISQSAGTIPEE